MMMMNTIWPKCTIICESWSNTSQSRDETKRGMLSRAARESRSTITSAGPLLLWSGPGVVCQLSPLAAGWWHITQTIKAPLCCPPDYIHRWRRSRALETQALEHKLPPVQMPYLAWFSQDDFHIFQNYPLFSFVMQLIGFVLMPCQFFQRCVLCTVSRCKASDQTFFWVPPSKTLPWAKSSLAGIDLLSP